MLELIAAYLAQKKVCTLPGLGTLSLLSKSASLDVANKQFVAPVDEITFTPGEVHVEPAFVNYVAMRHQIAAEDAAGEVYKWCLNAKEQLANGITVDAGYVGTFTMNGDGHVGLETENLFPLFNNVKAERVIHQNESHNVLVGDKETTNEEMTHFYESSSSPVKLREKWQLNAVILAALAIIVLVFHLIFNGFSKNGIGNNSAIKPQESHMLYESSP